MLAAAELATTPNSMARGLKTSRSFTIGVLIPDLTNPLFPPIVLGIDDRLTLDGYTPLLVNTGSDPARERASIEAMLARQVDGFIAATARLDVEPLAEAIAARSAGGARQPHLRGRIDSPPAPSMTVAAASSR